MKPLLTIACLVLLLTTALAVNADIARPRPAPSQSNNKTTVSNLQIVPDAEARIARLQVRQSDLKELLVALDGTTPGKPIAASITQSGPRTIIAGLLLFASLSVAGVWFARSARSGFGKGHKAAVIAVIVMVTIGAAAIITRGNAGPPPSYAWRNLPTALAEGRAVSGQVVIEVVPDDQLSGGMKLTIPLRKKNANGEEE